MGDSIVVGSRLVKKMVGHEAGNAATRLSSWTEKQGDGVDGRLPIGVGAV